MQHRQSEKGMHRKLLCLNKIAAGSMQSTGISATVLLVADHDYKVTMSDFAAHKLTGFHAAIN